MGLGNPIIYDQSLLYGYRPLPNQAVNRFDGSRIKINNLGLRAEEDWDNNIDDKILFLGDSVTYGGSYIDNKELFSYLSVIKLRKYKSGNAGVNGWGIPNIYGLLIESNFLPARIYVTTLIRGGFYRGLEKIREGYFYNIKPYCAFLELWQYFAYMQNEKRYKKWSAFNKNDKWYVLEKRVKQLKKIDEVLKDRGFKHLIFLSPSIHQALKGEKNDRIYHEFLKCNLTLFSITNELNKLNLTDKEKQELFYDGIHLSKKGHAVWAKIIRAKLEEHIP